MSLRSRLAEWTDWDAAQAILAEQLDLRESDGRALAKAVFWTDHPVGNALIACLEELAQAGILDRREEPDLQFRWNENFAT